MGKMIRIDKFLCSCLGVSRKEAKELIRKGSIQINGETVKKPEQKADPDQTEISCEGKLLSYEAFHYFMFHKPQGVVSATKDPKDRTVIDFIDEVCKNRLFPVGRLDKDTEGLLLLTDDGELAHNLLSPVKHVEKVYYAKVSGCIGEDAVKAFAQGVSIGNGEMAKPAVLEIISASEEQSEVFITITEGKFHQVKRMMKSVNSEVLYLKRLSMGSLKLDRTLEPGCYRKLTIEELNALKEN